MKELINALLEGKDLTFDQAGEAMRKMMSGEASCAQIAAFVVALRCKKETPTEISSLARVMRENAVQVNPKYSGVLCDLCGTGGDNLSTLNISTAAMFIAAAAGARIAKHGNKSVSSNSGSADVLSQLGVNIMLDPPQIASCIDEIGLGFMFAPNHHPALKYVMPVRRELGIRTVFNVLGPLANPAPVKSQLLGVYDPELTEPIAQSLKLMGIKQAMVVNGHPGLDELSVCGPTRISRLSCDRVKTYELDPLELGIPKYDIGELYAKDAKDNARIIRGILDSSIMGAKRDIVCLNSAATLVLAKLAKDLTHGLSMSYHLIDCGAAAQKLSELVRLTNEFHR